MLSEAALVESLQSADPAAALAALFEKYADRIYRLALNQLGDPSLAEDVVQETFLSALAHRNQFQGRSSVITWLYRIAYNASQDRLRQRPEYTLPSDDGSDDEDEIPLPRSFIEWHLTPEQILAQGELRAELERAIQNLPLALRVVLLLRDVEELSTEATAEALGISGGAVKVRLHRARLLLREQLSPYMGEQAEKSSN